MKMEARAFCSRMPSEIAIDMAMSEAEIEYSSQRHQAKASSSCRQYQNQYRSKAPMMHAQKWKNADVANHAMMSDAKLTGYPLSRRKKPSFSCVLVRFQPGDHLEMLFSIM